MGLWYWITSEFKARGINCILYGPEFWLTIVPIFAALLLVIGVILYAYYNYTKWR